MSRFFAVLAILAMLFPTIPPTPAVAGGGCAPASLQKIGTELIVTSPDHPITQVQFARVENLNLNISGGQDSAFVWEMSSNLTEVRWNSYLKDESLSGQLYFAVSLEGCPQPTLLWQDFPRTMWTGPLQSVAPASGLSGCEIASAHHQTVWDPNANVYHIRIYVMPGDVITYVNGDFIRFATVTLLPDSMPVMATESGASFSFGTRGSPESAMLKIESSIEGTPILQYSANSRCGKWAGTL